MKSKPTGLTFGFLGDIGHYNIFLKQNIQQLARLNGLNRVIITGDVFYPRGITENDSERVAIFKDFFKPIKCPVNLTLGNHDYLGDPLVYPKSECWEMPNYYYQLRYPDVDLVLIDTQQLEPSYTADSRFSNVNYAMVEDRLKRDFSEIRAEQLDWLDQALTLSGSKLKVVIGHYHLISNGNYDRNDGLLKLLMPIFRKHRVDIYISGHEHNAQHLQIQDDTYTLNHFILGNSAGSRKGFKRRFPGFFSMESAHLVMRVVKPGILTFKFVNNSGKTVYGVEISRKDNVANHKPMLRHKRSFMGRSQNLQKYNLINLKR